MAVGWLLELEVDEREGIAVTWLLELEVDERHAVFFLLSTLPCSGILKELFEQNNNHSKKKH